jgi:glycosyltransferase involved in cell wall biosynthesis
MRVLLLAQFYPPIIGGEERHVSNLAAALVARGHSVGVATQWIPGSAPFEMDGNVRVYRIRGTLQRIGGVLFSEDQRRHAPPFPDPELVVGLQRVVSQEHPDIVHAHNWLYASYLPLKKLLGVPLVVTLHDYSLVCPKKNHMQNGSVCSGPHFSKCLPCASDHFGRLKGVVTVMGLAASGLFVRRSVDKFITVSGAVAQYNRLAEFGVPYEVIPNFVPDNVGELPPADDEFLRVLPAEFILFVGDLIRLKGINLLLAAYSRLPRSAPPLVLIGRKFAETPPLPPNALHLGTWPHDAVMHAWDRCMFGVLPSIGLETFGIVIIEAMARGKPFIASDIGGMSDVIAHGETGLLVPPGDASALAAAMNSLLTNPTSTVRMGQTALERIDAWKAAPIVSRIEETYRALM